MTSSLRTVTIIILWLSSVWSLSNQQSEKSSIASNSSTIQLLGQFTEKILTKLSSNLNQLNPHINRAKARGYDWSYLDGYSHDVYGKSDYAWIIPLIIVVGFGTLLIPLMGTLMTTMITQGTINLTAGRRRRRDVHKDHNGIKWETLFKNVERAIAKFGKHF
ncbi:hypothetical protein BLOT_015274 [Blomia tropicalis]|nr:hypothetical protein BLOT_015274 [Blomia tropicalis]